MPLGTNLQGQRVLVTAASQGIGYAAAKAFLQEGASVMINSSNEQRLERAYRELQRYGAVDRTPADLSSKEGIERIVSKTVEVLGGIDTFVYVTGSPPAGVFMEKEYEDWASAARLLTVSPSYLARKVAEVMIAQGVKGRMVFLASWAIREPIPNIALSNVCRIAIAGLVRTLARELGPKGIRVNSILPGRIDTQRSDQLIKDASRKLGITEEEARANVEKEIPLGYIASPDELAKSILFLGSEISSYVTGAALPVDGGILRSVG
ncbi:MAG: SDR family oxidoreductase [Nitrososphaerota archaeon]|nr:SDR family oxidoreductase [Nitrososphaerota archaeon]